MARCLYKVEGKKRSQPGHNTTLPCFNKVSGNEADTNPPDRA